MLKRVTEFYTEIKDKHEKVAIVSHGGPIRALICIIEGITPKEAFERKVEYGEVIKVRC